jgi:hypothetical protein
MTEWFIQRFHKNFSQEAAMTPKLSFPKLPGIPWGGISLLSPFGREVGREGEPPPKIAV